MGEKRVRLPVDIREDGHIYKVRLRPIMPAHYRIYVTYGGASVPGSPISLGVLSSRASIAARCAGTGLAHAHVGKEAAFTIHCVDDTPPTVQVERLTRTKEDDAESGLLECRVVEGSAREWLCSYIPLVVGLYEVRIFTTSGPLPGSPFSAKVIDTSAIAAVGGWGTDNAGRVRAPTKLVLDTSNAGPGTLECLLAGRHQHGVRQGGGDAVSSGGCERGAGTGADVQRCAGVRGSETRADGGREHGRPHGSAAGPGVPEASLNSPDGESVPVALTAAGPGLWRATYTPRRAGDHHLRVLWAGRLVKVSAGSESGDASKVVCSGAGLAAGVVAYCELYEHGDGTFTLNVKPAEAGRHVLSVQFAGQHVTGSPFVLKVAGAPDPSKSRFVCDTRGAGAGQLTVRVRGPKGAFRVEMQHGRADTSLVLRSRS
ncbi:unnamed protein product [Leptidea sinapis]|uniref:Filamin n=1 Tax=Leptidea sinapis TaxID=189913 RepID=A0A5E4PPI8_9NEOP|nr:unnamed protein product [Leptidea sinapis]